MFGMIALVVRLVGRSAALPGTRKENSVPIVYRLGYVNVTRVLVTAGAMPTGTFRSTDREASEQLPPPEDVNVPEKVVVDQAVVLLNVHCGCTPAFCKYFETDSATADTQLAFAQLSCKVP